MAPQNHSADLGRGASTTWVTHGTATITLAIPLMFAFAGDQLLGIADTLIAGKLGPYALAAVGIGSTTLLGVTIIGIGTVAGVEPLAAQLLGANRASSAWSAYESGLKMCRHLALPFMLLVVAGGRFAPEWVNLEEATSEGVFTYLLIRSLAVYPMLTATASSAYLQAMKDTRPVLVAMVIANLVNVPLSFLLALGDGALALIGLPALGLGDGMGIGGIAVATMVVATIRAFYLYYMTLGHRPTSSQGEAVSWRTVLTTGWPIGLHWFMEVNVFVAATLLMGLFGSYAVAGHQIALQMSTFSFCACLGLSTAGSIRVAHFVGARAQHDAWRAGLSTCMLAICLMSVTAYLFFVYARQIAQYFTTENTVVQHAAQIFVIVAVYQVSDGIQAVMAGALRGLGMAKHAMVIGFVGYWVVGCPVGVWLAFVESYGPTGLWWGLTIGLTTSAVFMAATFVTNATKPRQLLADESHN
ncbi:MAG: MATE family efflux transporter [Bradymonadia bacterium]